MAKALAADAVLFGAVGGPKWDAVPYEVRPEAGLLRLRKDLELFANLRPAICYPALANASSLKPELVEGLDILIVRELTGGVYFGEPKEIVDLGNGQKRGIDTQVYDTYEIERIAGVAFELARTRNNRVCSMEKRNVMKSGVLWNQVVTETHKAKYSDVQLEHMGVKYNPKRDRHIDAARAAGSRFGAETLPPEILFGGASNDDLDRYTPEMLALTAAHARSELARWDGGKPRVSVETVAGVAPGGMEVSIIAITERNM